MNVIRLRRSEAPASPRRMRGATSNAWGAVCMATAGFLRARENFHLLRTCNVWTARALRLAGCPAGAGVTAENVMAAAAKCAAPVKTGK